ncbi:MAG: polymer-forming cytoskeletal protein [Rhodospirillaceae bacterium]|nr:polymer-forming cytoskeletal protein [Rhodospirillaceae bacterium]
MNTPKSPSTPFRQPDAPRRVVDMPGNAARRPAGSPPPAAPPSSAPPAATAEPVERTRDTTRKLQVGREITLAGEISACDHLVVEGQIEAKLRDCHIIEIGESGVFKGSAEVDTADIGGRFEGDLIVRHRLKVCGTGIVSGSVRYGELEVEVGGRVVGTMDPLESVVPLTDRVPSSSYARESISHEPLGGDAPPMPVAAQEGAE